MVKKHPFRMARTKVLFHLSICWLKRIHVATGAAEACTVSLELILVAGEAISAGHQAVNGTESGNSCPREPIRINLPHAIKRRCETYKHQSSLTTALLTNITLFYNSSHVLLSATHSQRPTVSINLEKIRCLRKKVHFWATGRAQQPLRQTTPHRQTSQFPTDNMANLKPKSSTQVRTSKVHRKKCLRRTRESSAG